MLFRNGHPAESTLYLTPRVSAFGLAANPPRGGESLLFKATIRDNSMLVVKRSTDISR